MSEDTSVERNLSALTGLPGLSNIYLSSCISYYKHVYKISKLGLLGDRVSVGRGHNLHYRAGNIKSLIKLLISTVNNLKTRTKLSLKSSSLLIDIESNAKHID